MKSVITILFICMVTSGTNAQTAQKQINRINFSDILSPAMVDFDAFERLTAEVKKHRISHLIPLDSFLFMSKQKNVIILDTRSDSMYNAKHIKGAIHLNFSDFNQYSLARLIPNRNTRILIYCNNNFGDDPVYFVTKSVPPIKPGKTPMTLALNIPTYINLYGYGYKNVFELSQLISVFNSKIILEGTAVENKRRGR